MEPIRIWPFYKAPDELRALSPHGGDEDWISVVPTEIALNYYIPWVDNDADRWFGCCSISEHEHPDYPNCKVYIGAHA